LNWIELNWIELNLFAHKKCNNTIKVIEGGIKYQQSNGFNGDIYIGLYTVFIYAETETAAFASRLDRIYVNV